MIIAPDSTDVITYFKLVDPSTGVPETALTIANLDATYVRDGAAAVKNDLSTPGGYTVTSAHTDNAAIVVDATNAPGLYRVDWPDAAFVAGVNRVQLIVNGTAIDPAVIEVELAPWLKAITGATVSANVTEWLGTAAATPTVAGVPEVDLTMINGVVQSATDLKDFVDTGYDPVAHKVQGVVLTDTVTTYTGNTPQTGDSYALIGIAGAGLTNVTISGLTSAALQDFFDTNSGDTYAGSVAGSVVKEIVDNSGSGGLTAAAVWANATRTLTQSAAQVADIVSGSSITIQRGDTLSAALTGLGAITGYTTLDFTVKYNKGDADTSAIIRIRKNASGLNDGLIRLNGAAAATAADGSITLDSQPLGNITINLIASDTDDLIPGQGYYYDVQMITGATVLTMTSGTFNVAADVTRLVS